MSRPDQITPSDPGKNRAVVADHTETLFRGFDREERRLSDRVARFVRELIVSGELEPGERVREVDIAARLGVSRAPVREAVLQLEREHLVETQPHRGATVRRIDRDMLREIAEVRTLLEGAVAVDLSRNGPDDPGKTALKDRLAAMKSAAAAGDHATLAAAHISFHHTFLEYTKNSALRTVLTSLWGQSTTFLRVVHGRYVRGDLQVIVVDRHEELLEAILSGDEEAVGRSMQAHISVPEF